MIAQRAAKDVTLPPDTMIKATLESELDSSAVTKGDFFSLKVLFATHDGKRVSLPRDSKLVGRILSARSAERENAGFIRMALDHLELPDGRTQPVRGEIYFLSLKQVTVEPNGSELTLRGRVDDTDKFTLSSNTMITPPARNTDDLANRDVRNPNSPKSESRGSIDLSKKKGRNVDIAAGAEVNIKILVPAPPPAAPPAPPKSK